MALQRCTTLTKVLDLEIFRVFRRFSRFYTVFARFSDLGSLQAVPDGSRRRQGPALSSFSDTPHDSDHAECGGVKSLDSVLVESRTGTLRSRKSKFRTQKFRGASRRFF